MRLLVAGGGEAGEGRIREAVINHGLLDFAGHAKDFRLYLGANEADCNQEHGMVRFAFY